MAAAGRGEGRGGARSRPILQRRGLFSQDLPNMMYAFGDVPNPNSDTVVAVEDVLIDYITDLCSSAQSVSTNRGKVKMDDLRFALRKPHQARQLARLEELLEKQREIREARQVDKDPLAQYAKLYAAGEEAGPQNDEDDYGQPSARDGPSKRGRKRAERGSGPAKRGRKPKKKVDE